MKVNNLKDVTVNASRSNRFVKIVLGRCGENSAQRVIFDCAEFAAEYGAGKAVLYVVPPRGVAKYEPENVEFAENKLTWTVSAADVAVAGNGACELSWCVDDVIAKTNIYLTRIEKSLDSEEQGTPPAVYEDFIKRIIAACTPVKSVNGKDGEVVLTAEDVGALPGDTVIPGVGVDGKTTYLHIKYSNDGGATLTANNGETPGAYIGQYTDFTQADSTSASKYTWSKIKGDTGAKGDTGDKGEKGDTGEKGAKGDKGDTGEKGAKGDKGDRGAAGTTSNLLLDVYASRLAKVDAPADRYLTNMERTNTTGAFVAADDLPDPNAAHVYRITSTDGQGRSLCWYNGAHPPLLVGAAYRLSCYAKANSGSPKLQFLIGGFNTKSVNTTPEWKRYEFTATIPESDGTPPGNYLRVYFGLGNSDGACELDMCGFRAEQVSEELLDIKDTANRALTSADGKNKVFYQAAAPTAGMRKNDLWFDTDDGYAIYRYDGAGWSKSALGDSAISGLNAGKITAGQIDVKRINLEELFSQDITATNFALLGQIQIAADADGKRYALDAVRVSCGEPVDVVPEFTLIIGHPSGRSHAAGQDDWDFDRTIGVGRWEFQDFLPTYGDFQLAACTTETSGVWTCEKYADGRLRCVGQIPVSTHISTAFGNIYRSGDAFAASSHPYPVEFAEAPAVQMTFVTTNNLGAQVWLTNSGTTTTPPNCCLTCPTSQTGVKGTVNITAEGRWK